MQPKAGPKRSIVRAVLWLALPMTIALIAGWRLWLALYVTPPRFNYIAFSVNDEPLKTLPGETLLLHPRDRIKILEVATSVPWNHSIRLVAEEFDINAIRYEEMEFSALFPRWDALEYQNLKVSIKHRNREIGWIGWDVKPFVEDWLEKADRIIHRDQRMALLERAVERVPEDRRLRRRLVEEYKELKQWKKAAEVLEAMAAKDADPDLLRELMELYSAMGSGGKEAWAIGALARLDPKNSDIRRALAQLHERNGRLKEAISEYEALVSLVDAAQQGPLHKHLGYLYSQVGLVQDAIQAYLKAFQMDPRDANLCYNLSDLYERSGRKDQADLWLKKALELNTQDTQGRIRLAESLMKQGTLEEADRVLLEALEKDPRLLPALFLRVQVKERQGNKNDLRRVYEKILEVQPDNETVIYNLGSLHYEMGNLKGGLPYLEKYGKLHPKDPQVHELLFDAYRKLENPGMAFKEAQILVNLNRHELPYYTALFEYLKSAGRFEEIVVWMEKGIRAAPTHAELREYLAFAYLKTGREAQALAQMEALLKARPKDVRLWLDVARLREKAGNIPGAVEAYAQVIAMSPGHEEAEEAYLRLRLKGVQRE